MSEQGWRELMPESVPALLSVVDCGDGCIRELTLRSTYGPNAAQSAFVVVEVRRASQPGWVQLTIELKGLVHRKIVDINTFSWVMLDQPQVVRDDAGLLHLDLDPTGDIRTPDDMAQYSHVYLAARDLRWRLDPLPAS
ncbi:hypothetical protein [Micromonospora okii]|uniref:hypothetical protein n=1 Tax=Micromonospora okii TaxID=1182970 RepID=UPI001E5258D2|nr:hypothetical protein [Micromonospora okii]